MAMQGKRGMKLENIIAYANDNYKQRGIARIDKIPTPTVVTGKSGNRINSGFYSQKSTVDYTGVLLGGQFVAFDCKQTSGKRLPLGNISEHQMRYMEDVQRMGGIAFLVIYFQDCDMFFRLGYAKLHDYWIQYNKNPGRRGYGSIPLEDMGKPLGPDTGIVLHYLKGLI